MLLSLALLERPGGTGCGSDLVYTWWIEEPDPDVISCFPEIQEVCEPDPVSLQESIYGRPAPSSPELEEGSDPAYDVGTDSFEWQEVEFSL